MATSRPNTTLPARSWILVTGATGYIAGHVIQQFLSLGYRVRGTVRSLSKASWLVSELFAQEAREGRFEIVEVSDMSVKGAYDVAIRNVSAVAHVATIATWSPDPNEVIPQNIAGVMGILEAAKREPSVKRFVLTSTAVAAAMPNPNAPFHVEEFTWNDGVVPLAWAQPPYEPSRGPVTYAASKVEAEKALWKFAKEENPRFVVNVVSPFFTAGPLLHEKQNASTAGLLFSLWEGKVGMHAEVEAQKFIDVRDVALMHVAAILDPSVQKRRIHTWSENLDWKKVLAIFRGLYPEKAFPTELEEVQNSLGTVDDQIGRDLVKKWGDRDGWIGLEQSLKETMAGKRPVVLGVFK